MSISRSILLWMSENKFMKERIPKLGFVRKAVKKFMPGETEDAALDAASEFSKLGIPSVFTKLGENITRLSEAETVRDHYLHLIDKIAERKLDIEISVKLTQLGFDLSEEETYSNFIAIVKKAGEKLGNSVFIDMESSLYTQRTIDFYNKCKKEFGNIGICIQAYLYRTGNDIQWLLGIDPEIRIVKGAYKEPTEIVFKKKSNVDENFFVCASRLMTETGNKKVRPVFATHDEKLIRRINDEAGLIGIDKSKYEFQMLYGIKTNLQKKLAEEGYKFRVLIAYGESWFPWYMRRLAERPANIWFVLKNIF
ncbi:MAG TPA: proline dehydrogenase family protein [Melioribacteraceae bacterium]|nr:proline dehydrogenase family protein [Melioribacteraceae bacterium]